MGAQSMADETIADFSKGETVEWRTVNDNVMGGRSVGDFEVGDSTLNFKGRTNTNGGGFSSIRASAQSLDLEGATGFRLKLKGDGRKYTYRLRNRNSRESYWFEFDTDDLDTQHKIGRLGKIPVAQKRKTIFLFLSLIHI